MQALSDQVYIRCQFCLFKLFIFIAVSQRNCIAHSLFIRSNGGTHCKSGIASLHLRLYSLFKGIFHEIFYRYLNKESVYELLIDFLYELLIAYHPSQYYTY